MASNYKSIKCDCCAGALEYDKAKKVWVCKYCGNEVRREEAYDGLYTIKNVVKQTLTDVAYGNLDTARKNLAECEKIASGYVGTGIARLCVQMFLLITPGACPQGMSKTYISQMKKGYEDLKNQDAGISSEEEMLYESFGDSADPFAVLVLTFDSLGDQVHRDFAEQLMHVEEIYSTSMKDHLLQYSLSHGKMELADQLLANLDNISSKLAMTTILKQYPDSEKKREHLARVIPRAGLVYDDKKKIEAYLEETTDTAETRLTVYEESVAAQAVPSIKCVTEHIFPQITALTEGSVREENLKRCIHIFSSSKPNDGELYYLVDQIFEGHPGNMALQELQAMADQEIYLAISRQHMLTFLNRSEVRVEEKLGMIELVHHWKIDAKTNEGIAAGYLNENQDAKELRIQILPALLSYVPTLSTQTITHYILENTTDGEIKPQIVGELMKLDLNLSFFRELLSDYMRTSKDEETTKKEIIEKLSDKGLRADSATLLAIALSASEEEVQEKAAFLQQMIRNGVQPGNTALSQYLEQAENHQYYAVFVHLFYQESSVLSGEACSNYLLYGRFEEAVKLENVRCFASHCSQSFGTAPCSIVHLGHRISCNQFQAYVLLTEDSPEMSEAVAEDMKHAQAKLNPAMQVDGVTVKFKKYITENRSSISAVTEKLCEMNKVFTLLF